MKLKVKNPTVIITKKEHTIRDLQSANTLIALGLERTRLGPDKKDEREGFNPRLDEEMCRLSQTTSGHTHCK